MGRRGFTLIELLVVIIIILILAAILFPVFGKVREKARQTTCMSNQRQIAMAFQMLNQDSFPGELGGANHDYVSTPEDEKFWRGEIERFADAKLFNCPSTNRNGTTDDPEIGMNFYLFGVAMGDIKDPKNTVITADANSGLIDDAGSVDLRRHINGYIAGFMDGHVDFTPADRSAVIWGSGDEGTVLSFAALHQKVTYSADTAATGADGGVSEGEAVLLANEKDAEITAKVSVSGGATNPTLGLLPGTSDTKISAGKSKAFALYCATDAAGKKVDTVYTFGDPAGSIVTITCMKPKDPNEVPAP